MTPGPIQSAQGSASEATPTRAVKDFQVGWAKSDTCGRAWPCRFCAARSLPRHNASLCVPRDSFRSDGLPTLVMPAAPQGLRMAENQGTRKLPISCSPRVPERYPGEPVELRSRPKVAEQMPDICRTVAPGAENSPKSVKLISLSASARRPMSQAGSVWGGPRRGYKVHHPDMHADPAQRSGEVHL